MTPTAIFMSVVLACVIQGVYKLVTGKDLFPANPKGPLYRWFGPKGERANHGEVRARLESLPPPQSGDRPAKGPFQLSARRDRDQ